MGSVSKIRKLGDQSRALIDILPTFWDIACVETAAAPRQIPHFVDGRLMPVFDSVLPLSKASEAHPSYGIESERRLDRADDR
jgi:hypothetical protein